MKKTSLVLALILTISTLNAHDEKIKMEGVKYIKMLGKELKKNLTSKMKIDSTGEAALNFCIGAADHITKDINAKLPKHASVKRVAIKFRSEKNRPEARDIEVMRDYIDKIDNGTFSPKDIVVTNESGIYRVYKPLIVKKMCLKCHGESVSDRLKTTIKKAYPTDLAMGFKEGDFRGVIVAEIKK